MSREMRGGERLQIGHYVVFAVYLAMNHLLVVRKKSRNWVLCWLDKFSLVCGSHFGGVLFSPVLQNVSFASSQV